MEGEDRDHISASQKHVRYSLNTATLSSLGSRFSGSPNERLNHMAALVVARSAVAVMPTQHWIPLSDLAHVTNRGVGPVLQSVS